MATVNFRTKNNNRPRDSSRGTLNAYLSQSDFIEHFLAEEKDPRTVAAQNFYSEVPSGIVRIHKTTRAGATVALCSESIRRDELFTLVCRTNRNITKTVKGETSSVVGRPVNVIHILRNSFCPRIVERIRKFPVIEKLGFIPLPDCDSCNIKECPIRDAFETPVENVQGYSLTYAKLQSLVMSKSKKIFDLLEKLEANSRNIIFDEVQMIQEGASVSVALWRKRTDEYTLDLRPYAKLRESSPVIQKFLEKTAEILKAVQTATEKLKDEAAVNHHLKHMALTMQNPAYARIKEKEAVYREMEALEKAERERLQRSYPEKTWCEISEMMLSPSERKEGFMREDLSFEEMVNIQEQLINAIQDPAKYDLTEEQIIILSKLLLIVNSNSFTASYVKGLDAEQISIQSQDTLIFRTLSEFISRALLRSKEKRIIFTTATFGSSDIGKLLDILNITDYVWGDPLNTSAQLLVVADKSRISPYNFQRKLVNIRQFIDRVVKKYGPENVAVCTMNKEWSRQLRVESTWYASDETEGVASKKRIWIFVGLAEKPVNAKDHLAILQAPYHDNPLGLQGKDFLHYVSQKLRVDSVHINTYQAISRAKDPEAKSRSLAIMIGAREEEVKKCLLWGPTRTLKPVKTEKGLKFDVEIQNPIGKPLITVAPLSTDVEESLHIVDQWITHGRVAVYKLNWVYLKRLVDAKGYVGVKRLVKTHRLDEAEVRQFLSLLPEFFTSRGISDYILAYDSQGAIKGIATRQSYEKQGKPCIILYNRFSQLSIGLNSWFIAIKAAIDSASKDANVLSPRYINHHVSSSMYSHLSEFLDALESCPQLCPGWIVEGTKGKQREGRQLVRDIHCLGAWAPSFPRRVSKSQFWANYMNELARYASGPASNLGFFLSVYSFPSREHPSQGGNPPIDTLFMDLDLESEKFSQLRRAWEGGDNTVLPELLTIRMNLLDSILMQARTLVDYLVKHNIQPRILLSGFKGVHVFIDFPTVQFSSLIVAKQILSKLTGELKAETGVAFDPAVVGDASRLCRIPNTIHFEASRLLSRSQYAVPVTVKELMGLTAESYDELCSHPRLVPISRKASVEVLAMLTRIGQDLDPDEIHPHVAITPKGPVRNPEKLEAYEHECTKEVLADEDFDELDIRPCFKKARLERRSLEGPGGHLMRIGAVMELAMQGLSIASIVRWFSFCIDYDSALTETNIKSLISAGYMDKRMDEYGFEHRKGLRCETIQRCGFCLKEECKIYERKLLRR